MLASYDTIEHVADPAENIAEYRRLVRPGGLVVISTGDITHVRDLESWRLMDPPAHLSYFSRRTLTDLLARHGLKLIRWARTGHSRLLWLLPRRVRTAGHRVGLGDEIVVYATRAGGP